MPIKKSAFKALKKAKKHEQRNIQLKKSLKIAEKKMRNLIASKEIDTLKTQMRKFVSILDKSVTKGIIHKNKASRKKSRILKAFHRLTKSPVQSTPAKLVKTTPTTV